MELGQVSENIRRLMVAETRDERTFEAEQEEEEDEDDDDEDDEEEEEEDEEEEEEEDEEDLGIGSTAYMELVEDYVGDPYGRFGLEAAPLTLKRQKRDSFLPTGGSGGRAEQARHRARGCSARMADQLVGRRRDIASDSIGAGANLAASVAANSSSSSSSTNRSASSASYASTTTSTSSSLSPARQPVAVAGDAPSGLAAVAAPSSGSGAANLELQSVAPGWLGSAAAEKRQADLVQHRFQAARFEPHKQRQPQPQPQPHNADESRQTNNNNNRCHADLYRFRERIGPEHEEAAPAKPANGTRMIGHKQQAPNLFPQQPSSSNQQNQVKASSASPSPSLPMSSTPTFSSASSSLSSQSNGSSAGFQSASMVAVAFGERNGKPASLEVKQPQPQPLKYPPNHPLGNTKHLCSICGDRATGKHYGVYSCEGCKGFFKRTIRKDIIYVCRSNCNCLIDMRQRNRCQYCRYQKCLKQGMKREAVQEEKQRLKLRATSASSINHLQLNNTNNNLQQQQQQHCDNQVVESTSGNGNHMIATNNNHLYHNNTSYQQQQQLSKQHEHGLQQQQVSEIVETHLTNYEPISNFHNQPADVFISPQRTSNHHNYLHSSPYNQMAGNRLPVMRDYTSFYNAAADQQQCQPARKYSRIDHLTLKWAAQMQIEQLLDWAKSVPKFRELLIDDQVTLLKAYWNELIVSEIAFKSIDALKENNSTNLGFLDSTSAPTSQNHHRSLCIGRGLFINEDQAYEIGLSNMFDRIIGELVVKMHDMRLDSNELACLRAIILFNPETQGLKTSQPIEEYRGNVYTTLQLYCRKHYEEQPNRFGKLLLRLPALRSIGLKCDSMRRLCDNSNSNGSKQASDSHHLSQQASTQANQLGASSPQGAGMSPSSSTTTMLGYQVKLLFFDICYEASAIDSFLRSNLMAGH